MAKKDKIKLANDNSVRFQVHNEIGNMLLIGNFDGICGTLFQDDKGKYCFGLFSEALRDNGRLLVKTLQAGKHIYLISTEATYKYFQRLFTIFRDAGFLDKVGRDKAIRRQFHWCELDCTKEDTTIIDCVNNRLYNGLNEMKFENIIQNPPYNGTLHFKFMELGIKMLTSTGTMTIIEPATWLINIRKNGDAEIYNAFKDKIDGHIKSVVIENQNKDFGVTQSMPFATTTIDMSQTFSTIDFVCCGEAKKNITSIYDCNLIGNYKTIWSIFDKVRSFEDMMVSHMTNEDKGREFWYAKCVGVGKDSLISGAGAALCAATSERVGMTYDSEALWSSTANGSYLIPYTSIGYHYYQNDIANEPLHSYDKAKKITDKIAWNVFGTKSEIENWRHFVFNNKLPLFLNICLTDNQHNNSSKYLPWLVDKQYTDKEINEIFGFTEDEIKLIDITIKKYERNSPWFKRYMCGKGSVSDTDVNNFVKSIIE